MATIPQKPKWVDPRTPVSVMHIGRFKVTVYDQALYDASLMEYPDNPSDKPVIDRVNGATVPFKKGKPAARYQWTTPLKLGSSLPMTHTTVKRGIA